MNRSTKYQLYGILFQILCLSANLTAIFFLVILITNIIANGYSFISWDFLTNFPSRFPEKAGILSALAGTTFMMIITAMFAIPLGVGTAIYLEEYARKNKLISFIKLNIQNLAGVPSIVYGILGLTIFVRGLDLQRSLLAGSLTMALLILPIITISAQEALKGVSDSFRLAGYGIGMTRWQVVRYQSLPVAMPGIMTGIILALSRAIGESAPMIMIGALAFVAYVPTTPMDFFTVMPIQIFNWTARPQTAFHDIAASGIIVLLTVLLLMNALAIYIRIYYKKNYKHLYS
ncbi:MAG: phosphate ABC transporter permease PstA [Spirochaetia bacterium]|nr:phosphate ABC transporter permease PstA [Spirochaetia bacterium]